MATAVTRWRWAVVILAAFAAVAALPAGLGPLAPVAAESAAARDLEAAAPADVGVSAKRLERLAAGMQGMVDDGKLAGVVTLLARGGKLVHSHVAGVQDVESGAPMARDSIFRIYSMTKPITGVALMMLHEEGKWRLNDPVSRYIPGFADLKVHVGSNADGSPRVVDAERPMTMAELMSHGGGLAYGLGTGKLRRPPLPRAQRAERRRTAPDDDRQAVGPAAPRPAGDAVVLQHRRRRAGLPRGEALRPVAPGVPRRAHLRASRHGRHRLLRSRGPAPPRRAHPRGSRRRRPRAVRDGRSHPDRDAGRPVRRGAASGAPPTTTCASRRCC